MMCMTCKGLIAEVGKPYSYSGKFCHCVVPSPAKLFPGSFVEVSKENLDEIIRAHTDQIEVGPQPAPVTFTPPTPPMTAQEFIFWLRGYLDAHSTSAGDWKVIAAKLAGVRT